MRYPAFLLGLFTAACVTTPAVRISDTLTGYGVDQRRADCIGADLQSNLSVGQLLALSRAARAMRDRDPDPSRLTLGDLLRVASELEDSKIPLTVARAAGRCNLVPLGFAWGVDTGMARALP
jgi:hypothetical protein